MSKKQTPADAPAPEHDLAPLHSVAEEARAAGLSLADLLPLIREAIALYRRLRPASGEVR